MKDKTVGEKALEVVLKFPGLTATQIARRRKLNPNTVNTALGRLCQQGFIYRTDPEDPRRGRQYYPYTQYKGEGAEATGVPDRFSRDEVV